ncbi:MAG: prepilin-type N-terminal cleavage/methylation domain-containing protein [Gammaproteobacteria bacterium]|nr:MAG: prepilin-type N-terminal cleavage/methylation domain-containing protein [Gammaproteobacteria bacterium]
MPTRAQAAAGLPPQPAGLESAATGDSNRMRGVTLIELLTVLIIVAVLSSLAVGSYRRYLLRSNRTDATAALLRIQVGEEKFFLQNNTYTTDVTDAPPTGLGVASPTPNGFYTITVTGNPSIATSFLATATATGTQTQDTSCPTMTIDDQGLRGPTANIACWH